VSLLLLIAGVLLLLATVTDVVWTTLGTHGGGPISKHVTAALWKSALGLHHRRPNHRALSFAGTTILVLIVSFWVVMFGTAWVLIFSSHPSSLLDTRTRAAADLPGRIYFVAYTISTMGNGDLQPNGGPWRLATAIATLSGIGSVTLAITFLLEVLSAVVQKRALGAYISDLGGHPRKILERAWTGEVFDSLNDHLLQLTSLIHLYTEQHLAYPVLHYFHSENPRTAATLRVAALYETVLLISEGVIHEKRPPRMVCAPLRDALAGFAGVIEHEFVNPEDIAPRPPSLEVLRDLGIPTVEDEAFAQAVRREDEIRRFLIGLLHDDGWNWRDLER
jgi:hypothetical protein